MSAEITKIEREKSLPRVESGPIQFGDDWPGIFLRGDRAGYLAFLIDQVVSQIERGEKPTPWNLAIIKSSAKMLSSCIINPKDAE